MKTAETWDSYKPTLNLVLNNLIPKRCLEFGIGKSTILISQHPAIDSLESVEHNPEWIDRIRPIVNSKVNIIYEPDKNLYPLVQGRYDKYDLIFIDGILRDKCLKNAKDLLDEHGVIVLHDAEREEYKEQILKYNYKFWQDFGHTIILMDDEESSHILMNILNKPENVSY